ncbi:MAG: archaeosortase/exosortase family protein [Sphingobacteriaceae bacterium]|nr:archaeosortase/exosortase family protein [Sphingobacteriaceae bacterium]
MLTALKQNRFLKFLVTSSLIYIGLYLFYEFIIKRYTGIDRAFIRLIINSSDVVLQGFGYDTFKRLGDTDYPGIGIDGSTGVWVGASCNALTLFFLFAVFVFAYPGHQKNKIWFIPIGIITIHILNIFRVVALALLSLYKPEYLEFNHTYTFTFIVYCYIFLLWMIWVNKYSIRGTDAKK